MKTLLKYAGNKQKLMNQITPFFGDWNEINRYIEPFAGSLGSALNANIPEHVEIQLSDANEEIIDFYQTIKENPSEVEKIANNFDIGKEPYYQIRAWDRDPDWKKKYTIIERAARTIYLNRRGFNGLYRINKHGHFTTPWNHDEKFKPIEITKNEDFLRFLSRANVFLSDWKEAIQDTKSGDLIYCDPPYVDIKNPDVLFGGYIGAFDLKEQVSLRNALETSFRQGGRVIVSNSYCETTVELYRNWHISKIFATRRLSSNVNSRGKTAEIIAFLHD